MCILVVCVHNLLTEILSLLALTNSWLVGIWYKVVLWHPLLNERQKLRPRHLLVSVVPLWKLRTTYGPDGCKLCPIPSSLLIVPIRRTISGPFILLVKYVRYSNILIRKLTGVLVSPLSLVLFMVSIRGRCINLLRLYISSVIVFLIFERLFLS